MKMIIELGTMEAKNSIVSGALLGLLEVLADFEKEQEAPSREFVKAMQKPAQPVQQPQPMQQPLSPMPMVSQQIYPSTMPNTIQQPQPPTGPIQQQMPMQSPTPMQQAAAPMQQPAAPSIVPTSQAPTYSMDQLAVAATQLVDAGKTDQLRGILQSFNVTALTELPKERYGEFATVLRQNGVKI